MSAEILPDAPRWIVRLQSVFERAEHRVGRLGVATILTLAVCLVSEVVCFAFIVIVADLQEFLSWENFVIPISTSILVTPTVLLPVLEILGYNRKLGERYRSLAQHDPLTGALNRHGLFHADHAAREGELLVVADVDDFKQVNDAFGHSAGDELLIAVHDELREHFGTQARICRAGGDEFIVITEPDRAVPSKLRVVTQTATSLISLGSMVVSEPGLSGFENAMAAADQKMYEAKRSDGDQSSGRRRRPRHLANSQRGTLGHGAGPAHATPALPPPRTVRPNGG